MDQTIASDSTENLDNAASPGTTVDRTLARRAALRDRHAQKVAQLMDVRSDLRGVHKLADFVDDAIRWTA